MAPGKRTFARPVQTWQKKLADGRDPVVAGMLWQSRFPIHLPGGLGDFPGDTAWIFTLSADTRAKFRPGP